MTVYEVIGEVEEGNPTNLIVQNTPLLIKYGYNLYNTANKTKNAIKNEKDNKKWILLALFVIFIIIFVLVIKNGNKNNSSK